MPASAASSSSNSPLHSVVAGAGAGLISEFCTFPFSTAKCRLQVQRVAVGETARYTSTWQTLRLMTVNEGFLSIYRGFGSVFLACMPARAMYFSAYEFSKKELSTKFGANEAVHSACGAIAQLSGSILWVPQDVIKERLQVQENIKTTPTQASPAATTVTSTATAPAISSTSTVPSSTATTANVRRPFSTVLPRTHFKNTPHAIVGILREEGVRGLFRGYVTHQLVWAPYNALYFAAYEKAKASWIHHLPQYSVSVKSVHTSSIPSGVSLELPGFAYPVCAFVSGAFASALTAPIDTVKTRLQTQGNLRVYSSALDCVMKITGKEGFSALFRGLGARIAFLAPNMSLTMMCYEYILQQFKQNTSAASNDDNDDSPVNQ